MKKRILGIDPGYGRVGFGIIDKYKNKSDYIDHGCIETNKDLCFSDRLIQINQALKSIVENYSPEIAAVEDLFFSNNVKTAIDVGQARGVILLTLANLDLDVREFTPTEIKKNIGGSGNAKKKQVQRMVKIELELARQPKQDDAADALAVALCAAVTQSYG